MRCSVALATHNGAAYVSEQVESILRQSHRVNHVVLSDDDSADATVPLVTALLGEYPSTVFMNRPALGIRANFSQAISAAAATGDIIFLCDQDDSWHGERVARVVEYFQAHPDHDLVFGDACLVDGQGEALGQSLFEQLPLLADERTAVLENRAFPVFLRRNLATGMTVALRRELWERAAPIPEGWLHDEWLAVVAAAEGRIGIIEEALVDYRLHGGNEIGVSRPTLRHKVSRVFTPRGDRNRGLQERTRILVHYLESRGEDIPGDVVDLARAKLRIETVRAGLPANRILRIIPVLRELTRGDYARYTSQGRLEVLRDLLQPA